jgi:hypothetical protein
MAHEENGHTLAVFVDFENIALGFKSEGSKGKKKGKFDINLVIERLVEKGKPMPTGSATPSTSTLCMKRALSSSSFPSAR